MFKLPNITHIGNIFLLNKQIGNERENTDKIIEISINKIPILCLVM